MGKKEGQGENRISGIGVTARLIGITTVSYTHLTLPTKIAV